MWWAMAAGAAAGYGLSLMTPSRHGFFVALGIVAGFALHRFRRKRLERNSSQQRQRGPRRGPLAVS